MEPLRLLLARHGQATSGPDHRWTIDDPLTALGHRQAAELADRLAALPDPPTRVVASNAVRAIETATPCAARLGIEVEIDPRLVEFGSGSPTPFTLADFEQANPYDEIWHPHDEAWWDGEPVGQFWARVTTAIEEVIASGGRPLVVSHGGTITAILRHCLDIPLDAPDRYFFEVQNASLTEVRFAFDRLSRRRMVLTRLNDTSHLSTASAV